MTSSADQNSSVATSTVIGTAIAPATTHRDHLGNGRLFRDHENFGKLFVLLRSLFLVELLTPEHPIHHVLDFRWHGLARFLHHFQDADSLPSVFARPREEGDGFALASRSPRSSDPMDPRDVGRNEVRRCTQTCTGYFQL